MVSLCQKPARRWVPRSAREALRKVFEDRGCREITPDETLALAAQFQGNPDAMQIMQLFRNWAQQKRRNDRAAESFSSQAQPTAVRTIVISILKIMYNCAHLMILRFSCTFSVEPKQISLYLSIS